MPSCCKSDTLCQRSKVKVWVNIRTESNVSHVQKPKYPNIQKYKHQNIRLVKWPGMEKQFVLFYPTSFRDRVCNDGDGVAAWEETRLLNFNHTTKRKCGEGINTQCPSAETNFLQKAPLSKGSVSTSVKSTNQTQMFKYIILHWRSFIQPTTFSHRS